VLNLKEMTSNNTSMMATAVVASVVALSSIIYAASIFQRSRACLTKKPLSAEEDAITIGGYQSIVGDTPLLYLPHISSLLCNNVRIYVKMECLNPGGTGKDRAALSMILCAEEKGELPPPFNSTAEGNSFETACDDAASQNTSSQREAMNHSNIPDDIHAAIVTALKNTKTHGILIEGTSGSTGISLASLACTRGHGIIVAMPDDQSSQKKELLTKLGCGVVVVKNSSISNPGHYVNVARRIWEWLNVERRYDNYYWESVVKHAGGKILNRRNQLLPPRLIRAAFMNQFENLANVTAHYRTTGPEIYAQVDGNVDAFIMSAGTGGTLVGVGAYLKERWFERVAQHRHSLLSNCPPKIVLVDPPGSSLYNKIKFGVAYASQQSEQKLRRHRYDTIAEGIGLDRITANFGLGCDNIDWGAGKTAFAKLIDEMTNAQNIDQQFSNNSDSSALQSKIIDDALSITDQQAVHIAHYLLRHEGLFVGSSSAMNVAGALIVASQMPEGSNVVTVVCDGGQRHTSRFWNKSFVVNEWGLSWPDDTVNKESILRLLQIQQ
jgi:cysteine synthase A